MSDILDKLAMEVAEWSAVGFHKAGLKNNDYEMLADPHLEVQWEQRRKELINEPDDSDAPKWANWKAQDNDGRWSWYEARPTISSTHWNYSDGSDADDACQGKIPAGHDWRTTLKEVGKVDSIKEVKLAWANGEDIQFKHNDENEWFDWQRASLLNLDYADEWRVKPKTRTHTQWERKLYCPSSGIVFTSINIKDDQFPSNEMWVSEPELCTYEIV